MSNRFYINNGWKFSEKYDEEMIKSGYDDSRFEDVRIPHTTKETPFHYFDEQIYQMVSLYRKNICPPKEWKKKNIILTLEGVGHEYEVFLNGKKVGEHHCGYTAFSIDVSDKLIYGEENCLAIKVDSGESNNIPPFGHVIDYMTYGGIYRDVYLEVKNESYIADVFLRSQLTEESVEKLPGEKTKQKKEWNATLFADIEVKNVKENLSVLQYIRPKNGEKYTLLGKQRLGTEKEPVKLEHQVADITLWDTENPFLYEIKTELKKGEEVLDEVVHTFGFRKAEFLKDGFYLNGKKLKIRGLNRHQSYPYVGYAMPKNMQRMDAKVLKEELGLNAVRTSHYPQSHYFMDCCDELGLLVFTEIPGWQYIGDEKWQTQAIENTKEMVKQYRNHTSIILWGVRINESQDNDEFYLKTNEVARKLDNTRPTAGVRAHKKSSLLEDVYTYNDFSHDGMKGGCEKKKKVTSDMEKPYLITEYNGHMYPTKSFDWEEHRMEHAIRHANVLNAVAGQEDICGSFGWCMADYNTHKDFGSGDRICYHGVMDMFRNPKMAADIYTCQQDKEIHLSVSSTMDIGEHPGCNRGKIWIFTNADSVKMYKNDKFIKEYKPCDSTYKNLLHGPILVDDYIGNAIEENENFKPAQAKAIKDALNATALYGLSDLPKKVYFIAIKMMFVYGMKPEEAVTLYNKYIGDWGGDVKTYKFEAIKDGKVVKTVIRQPMKEVHMKAEADHTLLKEENTYDVAAVRIQALDDCGNILPFYQEPVVLETKGPIKLIGDKIISLKGGMGGTYVKTTGHSGKASLFIKDNRGNGIEIGFDVEKDFCNEI